MPYDANHHSEADTRAQFIDPALNAAGWQPHQIRREYYFTAGRKLYGNRRGERYFVDYLLQHNNYNLAIVEAKKSAKAATEGLQQAVEYAQKLNEAEKLKVRFVFTTNGLKIYQYDLTTGRGNYVNSFPAPDALYGAVVAHTSLLKEKLLNTPVYLDGRIVPHYYQEIAIQKTMEAIADGNPRILLTLATGTGKTQIAFQIVHKLLQSKWNREGTDRRPKILFLADRNVLADQAINTFNHYEKDLVKIDGSEIRSRNGVVPTNAYIFFAIYQAIAERENIGGYYTEYPKDFFDLVIIDECHRGSANEEGSWRAILDYFESAVHLGLTATPKRDANVDTYNYFGKPVYEYSLKEGIGDGFLTPYKIKRLRSNIDEYVHTSDDEIVQGEVTKPLYEIQDFDSKIIIEQRTEMVAKAILEHMRTMDKTIVFCVNQDHALLMRDMINRHKEINDPNYCVRVTSDEGIIGRRLLEQFQDNDKDIPVILTSSQMLTTGVDARNVRNIVLCRTIQSIVEFKQIVGRGTRIFEGKDFFTIIDFTGATNLFYDPEWDGPAENERPYNERDNDERPRPEPPDTLQEPPPPYEKLVVKLSKDREIKITDVEVRFLGRDNRPLTAREFLMELDALLPGLLGTEEELRNEWANPETREQLLHRLEAKGLDGEHLDALAEMVNARDSDYYDLLAYLTFNKGMLTRHQRTEQVLADHNYFNAYKPEAQQLLYFILRRYEQDGIKELGKDKLPQLIQLANIGTAKEAGNYFGGIQNLKAAYYNIQNRLYKD